ncbi:hypothetical protein ALC62_09093 [Cyphomyrmex costatus]|uniref:CCHC-type domain-containing protein n=1 Tax=Cyphomyrmex costatus TaxID=456900 RepID=A0A151IFZ2_9HYME|nr:hypothetical protein ALC62_09093 [Cyphomyrmex costatus]
MGTEARLSHTNAFAAAKTISKRRELDKQRESEKRDTRYRDDYARDDRRARNDQYLSNIRRPPAPPVYTRPQQQNYREQRENTLPNYSSQRRDYNRENTRQVETRQNEFAPATSRSHGNNVCESHQTTYHNPQPTPQTQFKTCLYCKKPGHDINQCRRREYNNNLRRNEAGNGKSSPGNDANPTGSKNSTRPLNSMMSVMNREKENEAIVQQTLE